MITREQLLARKADLEAGLAQLERDAAATVGAIQDVAYWLEVLDAEGASAPSVDFSEVSDDNDSCVTG